MEMLLQKEYDMLFAAQAFPIGKNYVRGLEYAAKVHTRDRPNTDRPLPANNTHTHTHTHTYIHIGWRIKDDASILCDSEFRA